MREMKLYIMNMYMLLKVNIIQRKNNIEFNQFYLETIIYVVYLMTKTI